MNPDSTLAVTKTCPKDGVHLYPQARVFLVFDEPELGYSSTADSMSYEVAQTLGAGQNHVIGSVFRFFGEPMS